MKQELKKYSAIAIAAGLAMSVVACDKDEKQADIRTLETMKAQSAINSYEKNNSTESKASVEKAFADLDKEIRELEIRVDSTTGEKRVEAQYKLDQLKKRASELKSEYNEAKFNALVDDVKKTVF